MTTAAGLFTEAELAQYHTDGYVVVENLLATDEIDLLRRVAKSDRAIESEALHRKDGEGGITKLKLWNTAGDDLYGVVARSLRIVDRMEQMLGGEVYYYHSKMNFKEPFVGGAWAWHQDYGYWYNNGCLFPLMASCLLSIDPATRENGCLQVLKGSHHIGRMDHGKVGDQTGADPERVAEAVKRLELVYCETPPGGAIFFHCNLLHRSDQNTRRIPGGLTSAATTRRATILTRPRITRAIITWTKWRKARSVRGANAMRRNWPACKCGGKRTPEQKRSPLSEGRCGSR